MDTAGGVKIIFTKLFSDGQGSTGSGGTLIYENAPTLLMH